MPGLVEVPLNTTSIDRTAVPSDPQLSDTVDNRRPGIDDRAVATVSQSQRPKIAEDNGGLGIDEVIKIRKQRAPVAKLDQERLLSPAGIPKLRHIAKQRLKFRKGHEYKDATRLLNIYQLWLDDLYPRAKFADGLAIIEKLGHSKRIQIMRREWIAEGKTNPDLKSQHSSLQKDHIAKNDPTEFDEQLGISIEDGILSSRQISVSDAGIGAKDRDDWSHHQEEQGPTSRQDPLSKIVGEMDQQDAEDELDTLLAEQQKDHQWSSRLRDSHFSDEMEIMREMDSWQ